MTPNGRDDPVSEGAATLIGQLGDRLGILARSMHQLLIIEIPELREDAQLLQLLNDSIEANVETVFTAIRHDIAIDNVKPPTAALEHARRLAQRGDSVNILVRAYRLAHKAVLDEVREEIRASQLDSQLGLDIFGKIAEITFGYVDWISQKVVATYQSERDQWMENRNSVRALRVREVLDNREIDVDAMTAQIRYPLSHIHLAAVLWDGGSTADDALVLMERFVCQLGESIGASTTPLFIPVDRMTGFAWIPLLADAARHAVAKVRTFAAAQSDDAPRIAVGDPLPHIDGFRRSHQQAEDAHSVAIALGANAPRATASADPGLSMAALLGGNIKAAAAWVDHALGPLASPTANDARLRDTLRVFLRTGSSFKSAADELHVHPNTIKYRVHRAAERRGKPLTQDRLDIEVALTLCHWYGSAVLKGSDSVEPQCRVN
ncbi:ABC transporter substrate-binding protein [Mycolicibacterium cyprinidarum]|uniref:ABC transporter substrate-binding protein n=1 Tax=Mycolicibacterium cyprinidarum TaxID=2860311 RepID=A0ABQ4VCJ0_9MYCO|nr:ABC transporter substrate-binding protein [Mycolicibacterium sp. NGTWS0302]GJF16807.1 ABC transporter substrate-binding protein [Mycolicibacterium sp. NGTWSNA01]